MRPIRITAKMAEPIVTYGDGLHLDGPLAFACYRELTSKQRSEIPPIEGPWGMDFDLPLAKWTGPCNLLETTDPRLTVDGVIEIDECGVLWGNVWGWKCSAAIAVEKAWNTTHDHRRRPPVDEIMIWSKDNLVERGRGPRAGRNLKFPAVIVAKLRWYAVGDMDRVEYLLNRHIKAIGKLAFKGMGRVEKWDVSLCENDYSTNGHNGQVMRYLPSRMVPDRIFTEGPIRPPYHHLSKWAKVVLPEAWDSGL